MLASSVLIEAQGMMRRRSSDLPAIDEVKEIRESNSSARPPAVFEIRIYGFNIRGMSEYLKMMDKKFWTLRTSFSTVYGPWKTEINNICEMVHIAQYESLSHLLETRSRMASDLEWNQELTHIADLQMTFKNVLTILAPNTQLCTDFQASALAVYELQSIPETLMALCGEQAHRPGTTVVGRFLSVYGPDKTEYCLLRYPDPETAFDNALSGRNRLRAGTNTRLMIPTHVSNLK
ncbi:uncharacterized protein [Littorina saxatilis]|uniref:NIPSNAP domain-containing protein n=1 Tax=Littorina saxatilis TaxID=31220 RepID=A0AAN9BZ41_9CAEN